MQFTFRFKLMVGIICACLISISIVTAVCYYIARDIIVKNAFENMISMREEKKQQIEAYYELMRSQIKVWSADKTTIQAYKEYSKAFYSISKEQFPTFDSIDKALKTYYQKEYITKLNRNVSGKRTVDSYYKLINDRTKILQYFYTADNPNPLGKKIDLVSSKINNEYDLIHKNYHPLFRKWVDEFGYYDVFIVDANNGDIVYTAFKETDFATNLLTGPYKNTLIAQAFRAAQLGATSDIVIVTDFEAYDPSYSAPAAFIASPIVEDGKKLGVLILQIPIDRINNIMTDNKKWEDVGLGKTGETYLLGADHKMRSISRFFLEDPVGYVAMLEKLKTNSVVIDEIRLLATTILLQQINTPAAIDAIRGSTGAMIENSYLNYEVLSAYAPLAIKDLKWNIISEISTQEKFDDLYILLRNIGIAGIIIMILLIIFTFLFSKLMVGPLEKLVSKYEGISGDSVQGADAHLPATGSYEVNQIMHLFDKLVVKIDERMKSLELLFEYLKVTYNQLNVINTALEPGLQEMHSSAQHANQQTNKIQSTVRKFLQNYSILSQYFKDTHSLFLQGNNSIDRLNSAQETIKNSVESLQQRDARITFLIEEQKSLLNQIKSAFVQKTGVIHQVREQGESVKSFSKLLHDDYAILTDILDSLPDTGEKKEMLARQQSLKKHMNSFNSRATELKSLGDKITDISVLAQKSWNVDEEQINNIMDSMEKVSLFLKENDQEFFNVVRMVKEFEIQVQELQSIYLNLQKIQKDEELQGTHLGDSIHSIQDGMQAMHQNVENLINLVSHLTASYQQIPQLTASLQKQYTELESSLHAFKMGMLKE